MLLDLERIMGTPSRHFYFMPPGVRVAESTTNEGLRQLYEMTDGIVLTESHGLIKTVNMTLIAVDRLTPVILLNDGQELRVTRVTYSHHWPDSTDADCELHVVIQQITNPVTEDTNVKVQVLVVTDTVAVDLRTRTINGRPVWHPDVQALIDELVLATCVRALGDLSVAVQQSVTPVAS